MIIGSRSSRHVVVAFCIDIGQLTISPASLPHSFGARELSGAPPRAALQCSSEGDAELLRRSRRAPRIGAAELLNRSRGAPAEPTSSPQTADVPQPSRPTCRDPRRPPSLAAEPTRSEEIPQTLTKDVLAYAVPALLR